MYVRELGRRLLDGTLHCTYVVYAIAGLYYQKSKFVFSSDRLTDMWSLSVTRSCQVSYCATCNCCTRDQDSQKNGTSGMLQRK